MLNKKQNTKQANNAPVAKFRVGNVTASVWEVKSNDKEKENFHNVTIQKSYKDSNDEWQNTNQFARQDLPKAILALEECNKLLNLKTE